MIPVWSLQGPHVIPKVQWLDPAWTRSIIWGHVDGTVSLQHLSLLVRETKVIQDYLGER